MTPRTQALIDDLDFRASRLELEHAAKKDIIVTSHASRVTKRQASAAAQDPSALMLQRIEQKLDSVLAKLNA